LPSSLTRVFPRAFVFSTRPPVSVYGTGTPSLASSFSRQCDPQDFGTVLPSPSQLVVQKTGFASPSHLLLGRPLPSGRFPEPPASLLRSNVLEWYWNFHQLSFDYAFRPRLRSRLTLGGRSFPRNPWAFGGQDSHLSFRYLYRHSHFHPLHLASRLGFSADGTLPYHTNVYHPIQVPPQLIPWVDFSECPPLEISGLAFTENVHHLSHGDKRSHPKLRCPV
jgi:hypothetical protein